MDNNNSTPLTTHPSPSILHQPPLPQLLQLIPQLYNLIKNPSPTQKTLEYQYGIHLRFNTLIGKVNVSAIGDICMLVSGELRIGARQPSGSDGGDGGGHTALDMYQIVEKSTLQLLRTVTQSLLTHTLPQTHPPLHTLFTTQKNSFIYQRNLLWNTQDKNQPQRLKALNQLKWISYRPLMQEIRNNMFYRVVEEVMEQFQAIVKGILEARGDDCGGQKVAKSGEDGRCNWGDMVEIIGAVDAISQSLNPSKTIAIIKQILQVLTKQIDTPQLWKQLSKHLTPKSTNTLRRHLNNIQAQLQHNITLHKTQLSEYKKYLQHFHNNLGLRLMSSQSVQKRLLGLQLMGCSYVGEGAFYEWLKENNVLDMILLETEKEAFVNNGGGIFRVLLKNIRSDSGQLEKILTFLEVAKPESRKCVLKFIQKFPIPDTYSFHDLIVERLLAVERTDMLCYELFQIVQKFIPKIGYSTNQDAVLRLVHLYLQLYSQGTLQNNRKVKQLQMPVTKTKNPLKQKCIACITDSLIKICQKRVFSLDQNQQKLQKVYIVYQLLLNDEQSIRSDKITLLTRITQKIQQKYNISKQTKQKIVEFLFIQCRILKRALKWLELQRKLQVKGQRQGQDKNKQKVKDKSGNGNGNLMMVEEIENFVCYLLARVSQYVGIRSKIIEQFGIVKDTMISFKIFQKLLGFQNNLQYLKSQFLPFLQACYPSPTHRNPNTQKCLRHYFILLNRTKILEYSHSHSFETTCLASELEGLTTLTDVLMRGAGGAAMREEIGELLADVYTGYGEGVRDEGEGWLEAVFGEIVGNLGEEIVSATKSKNNSRVLGLLVLIKHLMLSTQILGVGSYHAHNSLVTTNFTSIKITNKQPNKYLNIYPYTYIHAHEKVYERKLPTNITVMEMLEETCRIFGYSLLETVFMDENQEKVIPHKFNGLTLEEMNLGGKNLRLFPIQRELSDKYKQKLTSTAPNNHKPTLTPKLIQALTQIFHKFAKDGKISKHECVNFVTEVTKSTSYLSDQRVITFMRDYDEDYDGFVTIQDFLRFYENAISNGKSVEVWKNLENMGYRYDLKLKGQPHDALPDRLLFRSYLANNKEFTDQLFMLSRSPDKQIRERSTQILFRLPTRNLSFEEIKHKINIHQNESQGQGDIFEIEYYLIAVQDKIKSGQCSGQMETEREKQKEGEARAGQIYEIMNRLYKENKKLPEIKCLLICIKILRSLYPLPDLRYDLTDSDISFILDSKTAQKIPHTPIFLKLLQNNLQLTDSEQIEAVFALHLCQVIQADALATTQSNSDMGAVEMETVLKEALLRVCSTDLEVRFISCNYIYILSLLNKDIKQIFTIKIEQEYCEIWYETLTKIITKSPNLTPVNHHQIVNTCLHQLSQHRQTLSSGPNPIIHGTLLLLRALTHKSPTLVPFQKMLALAQHILNPPSRQLLYFIILDINEKDTMYYLKELVANAEIGEVDGEGERKLVLKAKYVGLSNQGSTCYINSVMQLLFWIEEFRDELLSIKLDQNAASQEQSAKQLEQHDQLVKTLKQLQKIFLYLQHSPNKAYQMKSFCSTYRDTKNQPLNTHQQQDAHQFSHDFLDIVEKIFQKVGKKDSFQNLLTGETASEYVCSQCEHRFSREEKFVSLSLEVKGHFTIMESLDKLTKPQEIEDYKCESCNQKVKKITKYTTLNRLPNQLTINLSRIQYDFQMNKKVKISSKFQFPQTINLQNYVSQSLLASTQKCPQQQQQQQEQSEDSSFCYRLKAIIVHSGTCQSGHYYPIIKIKNKWVKFDDRVVSEYGFHEIEGEIYGGTEEDGGMGYEEQKRSKSAYILCFERVKQPSLQEQQSFSHSANTNCKKQQAQKLKKKRSHVHFLKSQFPQLFAQIHSQKLHLLTEAKLCNDILFKFCIHIFDRVKPYGIEEQATQCADFSQLSRYEENIGKYEDIFQMSVVMYKFLRKFWRLSNMELIPLLGRQICYLFFLLPQKTSQFLNQITPEQSIFYLCQHLEPTVKQISKHILAKSLHIFSLYYQSNFIQQQHIHIHNLIKCLKQFFNNQIFYSNIWKMEVFLEWWKICIECIGGIEEFVADGDLLEILLEILGHDVGDNGDGDGNHDQKDKKQEKNQQQQRSDSYNININGVTNKQKDKTITKPKITIVPTNIARLISNLVSLIYQSKHKHKQKPSTKPLTQKQLHYLYNPELYANILKNNYDPDRNFAPIIANLASNNEQFSLRIAQIFLKSLKIYEEKISALKTSLQYIISFLSINDEYCQKRMKWLLGISQLECTEQKHFGFKENTSSNLYFYVSTLYFSEFTKYKPILHLLYTYSENPYFEESMLYHFFLLLNLCNKNGQILEYLWKLPSPVCVYDNYFNWLEVCVRKLQAMPQTLFPQKKQTFIQHCITLYDTLKINITITLYAYLDQLPNYYLIGRNKNVQAKWEQVFAHYRLTIYEHQTYVLKNKPTGKTNQSISTEFFQDCIKGYFVRDGKVDDKEECQFEEVFANTSNNNSNNNNNNKQQEQPESEKTVYTFQFVSQSALKINFKLQSFRQQIYIQAGKTTITTPYQPLQLANIDLSTVLQVTPLNSQQIIWSHRKYSQIIPQQNCNNNNNYQGNSSGAVRGDERVLASSKTMSLVDIIEDNREKKHCRHCTMLNSIENVECQACGNYFN